MAGPRYNKVILIGRLSRDPEVRSFANGGKVASYGLAVSNSRFNSNTGQYEDDPLFIDCETYNQEKRKNADFAESYMKKGLLVQVDGQLKMDRWEDKTTGQQRTKIKVVVNEVQLLQSSGGKPDPESNGQTANKPLSATGRGDREIQGIKANAVRQQQQEVVESLGEIPF